MIDASRIQVLNDAPVKKGSFVLYWMQASMRASQNHALEYAVAEANRLSLPAAVCFVLADSYIHASKRHFAFMLEGLAETEKHLSSRGIPLAILRGTPSAAVAGAAGSAALVVTDRGYTRLQRSWRAETAKSLGVRFVQVESDVAVPVETASPKEEYSAATLRPKIHALLFAYLKELPEERLVRRLKYPPLPSLGPRARADFLERIPAGRCDSSVPGFRGGSSHARKLLSDFLERKLDHYADEKNDPAADYSSSLSPYLHFGQISPVEIALAVLKTDSQGKEAFLEELIVRRELAVNFCFYNPAYDSFACLPKWAKDTLLSHRGDKREYLYTLEELEEARTHDPYWNAAQREMAVTGRMQGYMRMYWGKKILEWSKDPEDAYAAAVYLNDRYELDGRDPNGYAGVAWCFGKHDRPWRERGVFGMVRYMNAKGLERKFDMGSYLERIRLIG